MLPLSIIFACVCTHSSLGIPLPVENGCICLELNNPITLQLSITKNIGSVTAVFCSFVGVFFKSIKIPVINV